MNKQTIDKKHLPFIYFISFDPRVKRLSLRIQFPEIVDPDLNDSPFLFCNGGPVLDRATCIYTLGILMKQYLCVYKDNEDKLTSDFFEELKVKLKEQYGEEVPKYDIIRCDLWFSGDFDTTDFPDNSDVHSFYGKRIEQMASKHHTYLCDYNFRLILFFTFQSFFYKHDEEMKLLYKNIEMTMTLPSPVKNCESADLVVYSSKIPYVDMPDRPLCPF